METESKLRLTSRQSTCPVATLGVALVAMMLAAGCGTFDGEQSASALVERSERPLAPAAMPRYQIGHTFIYSDRRIRRVAEFDGSNVRWQDHRDRERLESANFIVPTLYRETSSQIISYRIFDGVFGGPDDLWPLAVGKSVRFRVERTTIRKKDQSRTTRTRTWGCEVAGTATIAVPAGTFDTFRIECERRSGRRDTVNRRVTWYYAPTLGHYIRRDTEKPRDRSVSSLELVASLDTKAATEQRIKTIRERLTQWDATTGATDRAAYPAFEENS